MKHIDISALPLEPDDELRAGETYAVERDGEVVGYFVPRKKKDAPADQAAASDLARRISELRARGWLENDELSEANLLKRDVVPR